MQTPRCKEGARVRADDGKQFLVYRPPDLISDIKIPAVDEDPAASAIMEETLRRLVRRKLVAERGKAAADRREITWR